MPASKNIRHFTLVELMVVIVIIMIVLGISSGVFTRIVLGSSVDRAGRMVSSQLSLARAEAVAKRRQVAIIMPGANSFDDSTAPRPYRYSTMRAAYVSGTGTPYTFEEWVPGTSWVFLPEGALIAQVDGSATEELGSTEDSPTGNCQVTDDGSHAPVATVGGVEITFTDDGGAVQTPAAVNGMRSVVFEANGACSADTYVTIVEGIMPAGATSPVNLQQNNMNVIKVHSFTGKLRFLFH